MKMLLSTTALVAVLSFPTLALAQTTAAGAGAAQQQHGQMSGFLSARGQSDLFASELMGHDVYARRMGDGAARTGGQATTGQATTGQVTTGQTTTGQASGNLGTSAHSAQNSDGTNNMHLMNRADLDGMDNIGQVNDIVLSSNGEIRALIIGVGGFLGMGERDVAVTMDQVRFSSDSEDHSQMYIVVNTAADTLQDSPAYDRTAMRNDQARTGQEQRAGQTARADTAAGAADTRSNRTGFTAPQVAREGYNQVIVTDVSTDMLTGQTVYGVNDDSVGTVRDLIIDDSGAITSVIINFGGFLGMGTTDVSVDYEDLTIISNAGYADVRVYIDATKEQIQALPEYRALN